MTRVDSIKLTPLHRQVWDAYLRAVPWDAEQRNADRFKNPNGLHRLTHLVPDTAPDQIALARLLAESALSNRKDDFDCNGSAPARGASDLFERTKLDPSDTVRKARIGERQAWDALAHWFEPQALIERGSDGVARKRSLPIPAPVLALFRDAYMGNIARPRTKKERDGGRPPMLTTRQQDAVKFAIWAALESGLKATSKVGLPSVCSVVADIIGVGNPEIMKIWQRRTVRPSRNR